jgi:O-antigen ligase
MSSRVATAIFALGIFGLFALDREPGARTSRALWIPVIWMLLAGSRMVSQWLGLAPAIETADQALDGSPLDRNILSGLIAAGVIVLLRRRGEVGKLLRSNGPVLAFFVYCAVSVLWSDYPDVALKRWMKAAGDFIVVLIVLSDRDPAAALKNLLARVGFLLVPISILLIMYYPALGQGWSEGRTFFHGVALNKNLLGVVLLVSGIGCVWRLIGALGFRDGIRMKGPILSQGALLMMLLALFWRVDSMTSLACFVISSAVMLAMSWPALARRRAVVHLVVASTLFFAFGVLFLGLGAGLVGSMGRDSTLTGRTELWAELLSMNRHPLLGAGFESFWLGKRLQYLWDIFVWRPNEAHNGYLEVYLNLGWIGVSLLAFVMVTAYRSTVNALRRDPEISALRLGFLVAGIAYGFTEAAFRMMTPVWIVFVLAISAVPASASRPSSVPQIGSQEPVRKGSRRVSPDVVVGAAT